MSFAMKQKLTKITDKAFLHRALSTMNYSLIEHPQPVIIRGFANERLETPCELVLSRDGAGLRADIGFHQEADGSFTVVSDSYANEHMEEFLFTLKRTYEEEKAIAIAQSLGYQVASRGEWVQQNEQEFLQLVVTC